ncbi:MAG TPA: response regulator transcription factor [Gallionellaceae bacterium]|nr:response regulator transcription factor [Gallionellaceae bacterium]
MARILAIEDDETTAREIMDELGSHGFDVEWASDGRAGLERALNGKYDLITLDRMLPSMDGLTVVSELRAQHVDTPVLMISALSDVDERIDGLRAGGDDYLVKPFASEEMAARVEVLLRRRARSERQTTLRVADLELDLMQRRATRAGVVLDLMPTEFRLLEYMMRNYGQTVTRNMLFESVWGYHFDPGTNIIDVHIGRLRRKVDTPGLPPLIHTVRGSGYMLSESY